MSQIKASASDETMKTSNEMDRILTAVKLEDVAAVAAATADDEYFEDDQDDDKEYKELISNKSGNYMAKNRTLELGFCVISNGDNLYGVFICLFYIFVFFCDSERDVCGIAMRKRMV